MSAPRPSGRQDPPLALVTGAPGWVGSRLVEVLAHGLAGVPALATPPSGRRIRCLVHPEADARPLVAGAPMIDVVRGDLRDPAAARALCAGAAGAVLYHLAAVIHPVRRTRELYEVNVAGTRHLLKAAVDAGVRRVVAASSTSPFGFNRPASHPFDEHSAYRPYMAYGRSKRDMELLVLDAHAGGAIETVVARLAWIYGPHQPARQTRFFDMVRRGRFPLLGGGRQERSMTYVDNACQGLLLAAGVTEAGGSAYWIADERPYSLDEIVATIRHVLETELGQRCAARTWRVPRLIGDLARLADRSLQAVGRYSAPVHVLGELTDSITCSIARTRHELGYAPSVALERGMRESVRWCLANGIPI